MGQRQGSSLNWLHFLDGIFLGQWVSGRVYRQENGNMGEGSKARGGGQWALHEK